MGRLTAVDYMVKDKSLYFAEAGGDSIGLLRLKDSGRLSWQRAVAVEGSVSSLALDWLSGNLYWLGGQPASLQVAAPGGRWALQLLSEGLQGAAWLALCPRASTMCFVTAAGRRGPGNVVECAAMDGSGRRVLWRRARSPASLAFGGAGTRLYWADRGESGVRLGCCGSWGGLGAAPRGSPKPWCPPCLCLQRGVRSAASSWTAPTSEWCGRGCTASRSLPSETAFCSGPRPQRMVSPPGVHFSSSCCPRAWGLCQSLWDTR